MGRPLYRLFAIERGSRGRDTNSSLTEETGLGPPPLSWSTTDHEAPGLSPPSGWSSCRDRGYHAQWRRAGKAAYPYRFDSVDDAGGLVSGFLASYLLPFLASPKPSVSDLGAYTVFSSSPASLPSTLISHTSTRRCIYLTVRLSASQRRVPQ